MLCRYSPTYAYSQAACKEEAKECQEKASSCEKNAEARDIASFQQNLSPYSLSLFTRFSPKDKKKTMDLADNNNMTPDEAVAKMAAKP